LATTLLLTTALAIAARRLLPPTTGNCSATVNPVGDGLDFEIILYSANEDTAKRGLDAAFARIDS